MCTPDDGCGWHPQHVEWTCRIINRLLCVATRWTIINIYLFIHLFLFFLLFLYLFFICTFIYLQHVYCESLLGEIYFATSLSLKLCLAVAVYMKAFLHFIYFLYCSHDGSGEPDGSLFHCCQQTLMRYPGPHFVGVQYKTKKFWSLRSLEERASFDTGTPGHWAVSRKCFSNEDPHSQPRVFSFLFSYLFFV